MSQIEYKRELENWHYLYHKLNSFGSTTYILIKCRLNEQEKTKKNTKEIQFFRWIRAAVSSFVIANTFSILAK